MATLHRRGRDWPIDYDTLRPYYDRVQAEVGISGDAAAEVWRPRGAPYPMPPMQQFAQGRIVSAGFARLGMRTAPMPMAVASVQYGDRPPCQYDGWCDAGCPTGALANPLVVHMPLAQKHGAEFRARATVTAIERDGKGRPHALRYMDEHGAAHIQPATIIVLAGAGVQNARLLLANDLGNRSGPRRPRLRAARVRQQLRPVRRRDRVPQGADHGQHDLPGRLSESTSRASRSAALRGGSRRRSSPTTSSASR